MTFSTQVSVQDSDFDTYNPPDPRQIPALANEFAHFFVHAGCHEQMGSCHLIVSICVRWVCAVLRASFAQEFVH